MLNGFCANVIVFAPPNGAENFGNVISGLRKRVRAADGQLLEQIVGAEFNLSSIVIRVSAIVAGTGKTKVAVLAANSSSDYRLAAGQAVTPAGTRSGRLTADRATQDSRSRIGTGSGPCCRRSGASSAEFLLSSRSMPKHHE